MDGWSGADKLRHYLGIWRQAYIDRFVGNQEKKQCNLRSIRRQNWHVRRRVLRKLWKDLQTQNPNPLRAGDIQAGFTPAGGVAIKTEKKIGDDATFNAGIEIRKTRNPALVSISNGGFKDGEKELGFDCKR